MARSGGRQPQPAPCKWQGQTPAISQSGTKLELKIDKNELAKGKLTSNITVSAGPTETYVGGSKTVEVGGVKALIT